MTTLKWLEDSQDRVILNSSSKLDDGTESKREDGSSSFSSSTGYWTLDVFICSSFSFIFLEI